MARFTPADTFISFFGASGLTLQQSPSDSTFRNMPLHGSMMVFELFSGGNQITDADDDSQGDFPSESELNVRFYFRNGTDQNEMLQEYPLFGLGPSTGSVVTWPSFRDSFMDFTVRNTDHWCQICGTQTSYCPQSTEIDAPTPRPGAGSDDDDDEDDRKVLSPAIYGVIGAVSMLALVLIGMVILALCGYRLQRYDRRPSHPPSDLTHLRGSAVAGGGFKGAEKLASDTDLTLKGGAGATVIRTERLGSWEMDESPKSPKSLDGKLDKDLESGEGGSESGRVISLGSTLNGTVYERRSEELDRTMNPYGEPVKAREDV